MKKLTPSSEEFNIFKKKISLFIGINLLNYKHKQLERRIAFLMNKHNILKLNDYYKILLSDKEKLNEFTNILTINVSEFFRDEDKFLQLENKFIPLLIENFGENLKIWSAGCSHGAEIYSIAMILDKKNILDKCTLIASDFDENIIAKAKKAVYSGFKTDKEIPEKYKDYFIFDNSEKIFQISPEITSKIKFKKQDLLNNCFDKNFHLIVCRNVVIYFTDEAKEKLYKDFYNSLCSKGILFVGSTEIIKNHNKTGFNLISSFFYQK